MGNPEAVNGLHLVYANAQKYMFQRNLEKCELFVHPKLCDPENGFTIDQRVSIRRSTSIFSYNEMRTININ